MAVSLQNLNTLVDLIHSGIALGQDHAQALADGIADDFFQWKDPLYLGAAIAYALDATITSKVTSGAVRVGSSTIRGGIGGFGPVAGGAVGVASQYFQPLEDQTRDSGIRELNDVILNYSQTAREAIDGFATTIFFGCADVNKRTVVDYVRDGSLLDLDLIPPQPQVEKFYKSTLVVRIANAGWRSEPISVISTSTESSSLHDYPASSSYTSPNTTRTYTPYWYRKGKLIAPPAILVLNGSLYGIKASQIAEASARAWEVAGNNYTEKVALKRMYTALRSNGSLTPFQDGAGWEGVFSLPVCDIGTRPKWLDDYSGKILPCCCGKDCKDTREFVELAHLDKSHSWHRRCKKQLKDTELDFDKIDYGIGKE